MEQRTKGSSLGRIARILGGNRGIEADTRLPAPWAGSRASTATLIRGILRAHLVFELSERMESKTGSSPSKSLALTLEARYSSKMGQNEAQCCPISFFKSRSVRLTYTRLNNRYPINTNPRPAFGPTPVFRQHIEQPASRMDIAQFNGSQRLPVMVKVESGMEKSSIEFISSVDVRQEVGTTREVTERRRNVALAGQGISA